MRQYPIVIVGATGLVGNTLLSLLEEKSFPVSDLYLVASKKSVGSTLRFRDEVLDIEDLADFDFNKTRLAFFCVGNELASTYAPKAASAGNFVIDKSYFFRNDPEVPLIIPEVNKEHLEQCLKKKIIASPNCNTIPIAVALKTLYDEVGISRINVATYQSVSGSGKDAINELTEQTQQLLAKQTIHPKVYPQQIAFNVLPHIDAFQDNGYTREEMKIVWEMQKIYNDNEIAINPTTVRVPVFCGHSAAVHIETKDKITAKAACEILSKAPGVKLIQERGGYPTPAKDAAGQDLVYVGRVREDISHNKGLNLWVVADNLRKGAALNALQVADSLIKNNYLI